MLDCEWLFLDVQGLSLAKTKMMCMKLYFLCS